MSRDPNGLPSCDKDAVVKAAPCTSLYMNSHCCTQLGLLKRRSQLSAPRAGHAHCKSAAPEDTRSLFTENLTLDAKVVPELRKWSAELSLHSKLSQQENSQVLDNNMYTCLPNLKQKLSPCGIVRYFLLCSFFQI